MLRVFADRNEQRHRSLRSDLARRFESNRNERRRRFGANDSFAEGRENDRSAAAARRVLRRREFVDEETQAGRLDPNVVDDNGANAERNFDSLRSARGGEVNENGRVANAGETNRVQLDDDRRAGAGSERLLFRNENANATATRAGAEEPNRLARSVDERKGPLSVRTARNVLEILLRLREKRLGNRSALRETFRENGGVGGNSENGENKQGGNGGFYATHRTALSIVERENERFGKVFGFRFYVVAVATGKRRKVCRGRGAETSKDARGATGAS